MARCAVRREGRRQVGRRALGSRLRRWYAPQEALLPKLARWEPRIPELLPGEDRSFGQGLFVDLVPSTCWFTNVRSCVEEASGTRSGPWSTGGPVTAARPAALRAAHDRQRLEAHERWEYDENTYTQTLRRLIALCWSCHRATHFGFAEVTGTSAEAKVHLRAVNGWSAGEADAHIDRAFALWERRSAHEWRLDLSILTNAGIKVVEPPAPGCRSEESAARLAVRMPLLPTAVHGEHGSQTAAAYRRDGEGRSGPEPSRRKLWARIRGALTGQ